MAQTNTSLRGFLTVEPTSEQIKALDLSQEFINQNHQDDFLVIRGSAGTGKSTLVKAITDYLTSKEQKFVLAAPTGKAAKVIQKKTGFAAKTIHSLIYTPEPLKHGCGVKMVRKPNQSKDKTIFILDEASMISDVLASNENFIASKPLLTDLLDYIKQGNKENQIIFIGDIYQLAPVGSTESPALSPNYLISKKGLKGTMVELTEVKRQDKDSYILKNATLLRQCMESGIPFTGIDCKMLSKSTNALYKYIELYEAEQFNKVTILAWTNKDVNWFNNAIRDRLGYNPKPLFIGDQIQVHQNWLGNGRMIMKGDTGIIRGIDNRIESYAGLQFVNTDLEFVDGVGDKFSITTKVLLDAVTSADGEIGHEKESALFAEAMRHNATFRESRMPSDDKYTGAMRLRYGYAITCHKAQGGEWDNVILHPYIPRNDYRWQYTAITRAAKGALLVCSLMPTLKPKSMKETNKPSIIHRLTNEEIESSQNQMFQFVTAILKKDLDTLESVLQEKFTYFDTKSKWETLEYFKRQFATEIPSKLETEDVGMYYCTSCQPGNPALMFHHGYWPILEDEENLPKSLMLSFKDGLISDLTMCYGFCNAKRLQEIAIQN